MKLYSLKTEYNYDVVIDERGIILEGPVDPIKRLTIVETILYFFRILNPDEV